MPYIDVMNARTGLVDPVGAREKGSELAARYAAAAPFPNIMIDDFLPPAILDMALAEFEAARSTLEADEFDRSQERFKASFNPDVLPERLRNLFYSFNSKPFIRVLENITGIRGLIPDPFFVGAGIHEIRQGGHLSIHADFNHHKMMNLERRINVLIYLNKDWQDDYGGQLELWDTQMTKKEHSIVPLFNRCVIFNTTSNSQHGNPNPITHPDGITRKSIALYYYTSTWDATKRSHTTQFQVRPGSTDRRDVEVRRRELMEDWVPPAIRRNVAAVRRRVGKLVGRSA
ncbi:2OG-Fe(II) oxygenase [Sphingomonas sp. 1P08PE]|uniref:2OG-Fe(II) oxygenase n=1 Tax=Sphingomonas sp. 1P08PE TaxID=554122 RepID=UPI00399F2FA0